MLGRIRLREGKSEMADVVKSTRPIRMGLGPGGVCYCPACGYKMPRTKVGVRCMETVCPHCRKSVMYRVGKSR